MDQDQVIIPREACGCPSDSVNIASLSDLCKLHQEEYMALSNPVVIESEAPQQPTETISVIEYAPEKGVKFDSGKAKLSMIPRPSLEAISEVFQYGANKYGKNNYRKGMQYSRLIDAAMRHLVAFADREDTDSESGLSHLAHCATNLCMLIEYTKKGIGEDDR